MNLNPTHRLRIAWLAALLASACGTATLDVGAGDGEIVDDAAALAAPASAIPEPPSIARDVHLVEGSSRFTVPYVPPFRKSNDGRIGLNLKEDNKDGSQFYLLTPERLAAPLMLSDAGATIVSPAGATSVAIAAFRGAGGNATLTHATLCDESTLMPDAGRSNPTLCSDGVSDCYDLTVVATWVYNNGQPDVYSQIWGTPVHIEVANPKTASASIRSIVAGTPPPGARPQVSGPMFAGITDLLEPMVTEDGHLLVARTSNSMATWTAPDGGVKRGPFDIIYSVGAVGAQPCDVRQWKALTPISHAPFDSNMKGRYGLAQYQFRDPEGAYIPDGVDIKGTYPWIDRRGNNVFFGAVSAMLYYRDELNPTVVKSEYPADCDAHTGCTPTPGGIIGGNEVSANRGVTMGGLWTHGKLVLLDGRFNNTDFGLGRTDADQRTLSLYQDPNGTGVGKVRVGMGRDNSPGNAPFAYSINTTFIESTENLFNYRSAMVPVAFRDVVWHLTTGRATDELVFDDYLDDKMIIFSDMTASMSFAGDAIGNFKYRDGFRRTGRDRGAGFVDPVFVQNAATALGVPASGEVIGGPRIEPVAAGGIAGKGLWLERKDRVQYAVSGTFAGEPTFASLFLDSRLSATATARLLTFPNGSFVQLNGRTSLTLNDGAGGTLNVTLARALAATGYTHFAFQSVVNGGGRTLTVSQDGFVVASAQVSSRMLALTATAGNFVVGSPDGKATGLRGWIDEVKLIHKAQSLELTCNHARGTLIAEDNASGSAWENIALRFPTSSHQAVDALLRPADQGAQHRYACFHDYAHDYAANMTSIPAGWHAVKGALLFPEGPLKYGAFRPNSSGNAFCLGCHADKAPFGFSLDALKAGLVPMQVDHRRQPMQPPRVISGVVPARLAQPANLPATKLSFDVSTFLDQWMYP